ncbi:hypothetical protein [Cellulomonas marina]|uniref:Uncharacterized protein n=1 Tax=Cellulomonas marina TaxID=988821 RepID=A0A1I1AI74_9CELL|nr:hypothetical protein [Cellulomonas marina]GIG29701.1 hypothetical protein Cma02nite_23010 [Cellulomonas marina]SFB36150.1 hypothetical protein SAMN05421867_11752 [Cellulomonas marina]
MTTHTLTLELQVDITDEDALVDAVRASTPEDSLQPDDIRPEDRAASSLVAAFSKAGKDLQVPGLTIQDVKVVERDA